MAWRPAGPEIQSGGAKIPAPLGRVTGWHGRSAEGKGGWPGEGPCDPVEPAAWPVRLGCSAGAELWGVAIGLVVFGDQQAKMRREVRTARRGRAAEQASAARWAAALLVWTVFIQYRLQCGDNARKLVVGDPRCSRRVGRLPSTGEIGQVTVQRGLKVAED